MTTLMLFESHNAEVELGNEVQNLLAAVEAAPVAEPAELMYTNVEDVAVCNNKEPDMDDLFDFEITDELKALASGYESIGDQVRTGRIPNALLADLLIEGESDE